ncbi:hypothetical protein, partial [Turicimonas muris]|uniref:hypothetical protein n=1 Tax=Turicimonas muris TaxID=1796652 RepID=UPI0023F168BD
LLRLSYNLYFIKISSGPTHENYLIAVGNTSKALSKTENFSIKRLTVIGSFPVSSISCSWAFLIIAKVVLLSSVLF